MSWGYCVHYLCMRAAVIAQWRCPMGRQRAHLAQCHIPSFYCVMCRQKKKTAACVCQVCGASACECKLYVETSVPLYDSINTIWSVIIITAACVSSSTHQLAARSLCWLKKFSVSKVGIQEISLQCVFVSVWQSSERRSKDKPSYISVWLMAVTATEIVLQPQTQRALQYNWKSLTAELHAVNFQLKNVDLLCLECVCVCVKETEKTTVSLQQPVTGLTSFSILNIVHGAGQGQ